MLQEVHAGQDVLVEVPAPAVGVTLAPALAPPVVQQDPVAVAREHPRGLPGAGAAREHDHRGAVLRRDVPALQLQAVTRLQAHVLVGRPQLGTGHVGSEHVRLEVGDRERNRGDHQNDEDTGRPEQAAPVAAGRVIAQPARLPERREPHAGQHGGGGQGQEAGVVVSGEAPVTRVVDALGSAEDGRERPAQGERGPRTVADPRVGPDWRPRRMPAAPGRSADGPRRTSPAAAE